MRRLIITTVLFAFAAQAQAADFATGQFKMYDEPRHEPFTQCDRYTELTLETSEFLGNFVVVANRLSATSSCEIAAVANPRFFELSDSQTTVDGCGTVVSKGYLSQWVGDAEEFYTLTVWDNRSNTCEVPIPALIVAELKNSAGDAYRMYSYDQ